MTRRSTSIDTNARRAKARRTALIVGVVAFVIYAAAILQVVLR